MLVKYSALFAVLCVLFCGNAFAQAVWQADVQIQSFTVTAASGMIKIPRPVPLPRTGIPGPGPNAPPPIPSNALDVNVTVLSNNDDDARNVKLLVFLPPESRVITMPASCVASQLSGPNLPTNAASVTCPLGDLTVNATQSVRITIARPPSHVVPRVGVFAYSDSPDPNTGNNHAEVVAQ
jgi:Domain of unknown function DUF11